MVNWGSCSKLQMLTFPRLKCRRVSKSTCHVVVFQNSQTMGVQWKKSWTPPWSAELYLLNGLPHSRFLLARVVHISLFSVNNTSPLTFQSPQVEKQLKVMRSTLSHSGIPNEAWYRTKWTQRNILIK